MSNDNPLEILYKNLDVDGQIILFEGKPFTGVAVDYYKNGNKKLAKHFKNGKKYVPN